MPKDTNGNITIPNTFTPATQISSSQMNANFADFALLVKTVNSASVAWDNTVQGMKPNPAGYLDAPAGTRMLFQQASAPLGWVKETAAGFNNSALRLVTGGSVTVGGSTDFTTVFAARTILQANLPNINLNGLTDLAGNHQHGPAAGNFLTQDAGGVWAAGGAGGGSGLTGLAGNHQHTFSVALGGSGTALDFAVRYVDLITAEKA
jgi:hypothetical protein